MLLVSSMAISHGNALNLDQHISIPNPAEFQPKCRTRVFDVENDDGGQKIRCALPVCSRHTSADSGYEWFENVDSNVKRLEDHVGQEIESWLHGLSLRTQPLLPAFETQVAVQWTHQAPMQCSKRLIIAVLELQDVHATMGPWIFEFLKATSLSSSFRGSQSSNATNSGSDWALGTVTLPFASRRQLLASVSSLAQLLVEEQTHIFIVLSTHGSSQGQVLACTPSHVSSCHGDYEEFCSLDNFVLTAQDTLGSSLVGIHCSSCFLLALDSSHKNWPCAVSWIKSKLQCQVTGSHGEIFETGSQAADLMMLMLTLRAVLQSHEDLPSKPGVAKKRRLSSFKGSRFGHVVETAYHKFVNELGPNLAHEMGLTRLCQEYAKSRLTVTEDEPSTHLRPYLSSRVSLVLLVTDVADGAERSAKQLSHAVQVNMAMRSDVQSVVHCITVPGDCLLNTTQLATLLAAELSQLNAPDLSYFFVVLSPVLCTLSTTLLANIKSFRDKLQTERGLSPPGECHSSDPAANPTIARRCVFGVYLHHVDREVFDGCTHRWRELQPMQDVDGELLSLPVVMAVNHASSPLEFCYQLPLLLYMLHLCVGENCVSLNKDKDDVRPYRPSRWILERVYTEVVMMLSGLAQRCRLTLLSPSPIAIENHSLRFPLPAAVSMKTWRSGLVCRESCADITEDNPLAGLFRDILDSHVELEKKCCQTDALVHESNTGSSPETADCVSAIGIKVEGDKQDSPTAVETVSTDLPISCNWQEIAVKHYSLNWSVDFEDRDISGHIQYCIGPVSHGQASDGSCRETDADASGLCPCASGGIAGVDEIRLDCHDLAIREVHGLVHSSATRSDFSPTVVPPVSCCERNDFKWYPLNFRVSEHDICCSKASWMCCLPLHIRIRYLTMPACQSLTWAKDVDGRQCVFTRGASVNNRSLFPGQDTPHRSSTWDAVVSVPSGCRVVMSGDRCQPVTTGHQADVYSCSMSIPMWCCTLAFSAGWFTEQALPTAQTVSDDADDCCTIPPVSIWCPQSLCGDAFAFLGNPCLSLVKHACSLLGRYPFHHLALVLLPRSFGCLGLASPNMLFLSPSLLTAAPSTQIRLSHEISHAWFGLHIGARIWTEEWLSEGFATYCEDRIDCLARQARGEGMADLLELEDIRLRLKVAVLKAELEHTNDDLQVLVPQTAHKERVVNALNDEKLFCQVHYIKGYLLLHHLAATVGVEAFDTFLARLTLRYGGENISTQELLQFFFETTASEFRSASFCPARLLQDWLQCPGVPPLTHLIMPDADNSRLQRIYSQLRSLLDMVAYQGNHTKQHHAALKVDAIGMTCYEFCLLLSHLVQANINSLKTCCARHIRFVYGIDDRCAEEQHLWCELIVKHRCQALYSDVEKFLTEHQGMGVYLYGELILTRQKRAQQLACELYRKLKDEMDTDARRSVHTMLSPLLT